MSAPTEFVYFVQAGDETGPIKIGYSSNVEKRIEALRTGNHLPLRILASFEVSGAMRIEQALHSRFSDLRLEGEWFRYDERIAHTVDAWRSIASRRSRSTVEPFISPRFMASLPSVGTLDGGDLWVVEWSDRQGHTHVDTLDESLATAREVLLFGRGDPGDYTIVAIVATQQDAHDLARALEPQLHAVRAMRRILDGDTA